LKPDFLSRGFFQDFSWTPEPPGQAWQQPTIAAANTLIINKYFACHTDNKRSDLR
jgi:hypothetical protein